MCSFRITLHIQVPSHNFNILLLNYKTSRKKCNVLSCCKTVFNRIVSTHIILFESKNYNSAGVVTNFTNNYIQFMVLSKKCKACKLPIEKL